MADMKNFIDSLLEGAGGSKAEKLNGRTYRDEPILMTAAQMADYTPPKYREMRMIGRKFRGGQYRNYLEMEGRVFYEEARFMQDYEDQVELRAEIEDIFRPGYEDLTDRELRMYFTWRRNFRHGNPDGISKTFARIYSNELINLIGVRDPEEGYRLIQQLRQVCAEKGFGKYFDLDMKEIAHDFVVYYDLPAALLNDDDSIRHADSVRIISDHRSCSPHELMGALDELSSYSINKSRFYKANPEDMEAVVYGAFDQLYAYYGRGHKVDLVEKFAGAKSRIPYRMFGYNVFFEKVRHPDGVYDVDGLTRYICSRGNWVMETLMPTDKNRREVKKFLKSVDFRMREMFDFTPQIKDVKVSKLYDSIIREEIGKILDAKREAARPRIEIDLSKLDRIRAAAEKTARKLIVEDENFEEEGSAQIPLMEVGTVAPAGDAGRAKGDGEAETEGKAGAVSCAEIPKAIEIDGDSSGTEIPNAEAGREAAGGAGAGTAFSPLEREFLSRLLRGEPYADLPEREHVMLSILVDGINEKFYDLLGDTGLEFEGEEPVIIEDYREDIEALL
ncbi:MAG: TerB N-terminal domain-containing protein [Clostridia bacterium]|nr:TerB N-terminal domain-containing protein [Clostridia bacterium]